MKIPVTESGMVVALKVQAKRRRTPTDLVSVVMRLRKSKNAALDQLAKDTRIRKSVLLREAIADMLVKRNAMKQEET